MPDHRQQSYHTPRGGRWTPAKVLALGPGRRYIEQYVADRPGHYPSRKSFARAMEPHGMARGTAWRIWETLRREKVAQHGPLCVD